MGCTKEAMIWVKSMRDGRNPCQPFLWQAVNSQNMQTATTELNTKPTNNPNNPVKTDPEKEEKCKWPINIWKIAQGLGSRRNANQNYADILSHSSEWLTPRKGMTAIGSVDAGREQPLATAAGNVNQPSYCGSGTFLWLSHALLVSTEEFELAQHTWQSCYCSSVLSSQAREPE